MSWSLQIQNGDLALGGSGFGTVSGSDKIIQDLRCALLESLGNDTMHPTYGSILDGGVGADGTVYPGVIGQINDQTSATLVQAELQRIVKIYQGQQITRNNSDIAVYSKSTLTADEAVLNITNVNIQRVADSMLVGATLVTGAGGLPLVQTFTPS